MQVKNYNLKWMILWWSCKATKHNHNWVKFETEQHIVPKHKFKHFDFKMNDLNDPKEYILIKHDI